MPARLFGSPSAARHESLTCSQVRRGSEGQWRVQGPPCGQRGGEIIIIIIKISRAEQEVKRCGDGGIDVLPAQDAARRAGRARASSSPQPGRACANQGLRAPRESLQSLDLNWGSRSPYDAARPDYSELALGVLCMPVESESHPEPLVGRRQRVDERAGTAM